MLLFKDLFLFESRSSVLWLTPQMATTAEAEPSKPRAWSILWASPVGAGLQSPRDLSLPPLLSQAESRDLDPKWSSRVSNQSPHGVPALSGGLAYNTVVPAPRNALKRDYRSIACR